MDSKKNTFITLLTLLILFEPTEGKGLCQFAKMFSSKGSESCFQGKPITIENKAPITIGKSVNPTTEQQKASTAATPQTYGPTTQATSSAATTIGKTVNPTTAVQQETSAVATPQTNGSTAQATSSAPATIGKFVNSPTAQQKTSAVATSQTKDPTAQATSSATTTIGKSVNSPTAQEKTSAVATSQTYGPTAQATSTELAVTGCPPNMVYGNCSCQFSCDNPPGRDTTSCDTQCLESETCVCAEGFLRKGDDCVTPSACGCFINETDLVIPNNETYIDAACSEKCVCQEGQLNCNTDYVCSPNATCGVKDGVRQCYCNEGYVGDGETCSPIYKDCYDAYEAGQHQNGVFTILPAGWPGSPFDVYCDMTTAGGGWTVFQRRVDNVTDFYRNWTSYRNGFGSVQQGSDFWLGNEQLHYLTNCKQRSYKLRIDIVTSQGASTYAEYASFRTGNESTKYRLVDLSTYTGNASHGMKNTMGTRFSTYDDDNDGCVSFNCAKQHRGAWWHSSYWCDKCFELNQCNRFQHNSSCFERCSPSNLNGDYRGGNGHNIFWHVNLHCNLISAEMKIRPVM